jgi:hypothetical protein
MKKIVSSSFKLKDYVMPSGKIIKIQGYEHFALNELIYKNNVLENEIITGCENVPTIWYNDELNKKHKHYVDIFIPSQNKCIEVKSEWTAELNKHNIFLKQNAAKEAGYLYEIWIFNNDGNKIKLYN